MKKTLIALSVMTSVYAFANSNYVSIVDGNEISYISGGFTDRVEYTNWVFDREDNCSFDNSEADYYFGQSFNKVETCDEVETRTATTIRTYDSGSEEIVSTITEERSTTVSKAPIAATGTHLEQTCKGIQTFDSGLTDGYYTINPSSNMQVYCDMTTSGGGWTLIQKEPNSDTTSNIDYSLFVNNPVNDGSPQSSSYRMSRSNMNLIQSLSTEMRVDCRGSDYLETASSNLFMGEGIGGDCSNNAEILYSSASLLGNEVTNKVMCTWFTSRKEGCAGAWHIDEDAQTYGRCNLPAYPWTGSKLSSKNSVDYFAVHEHSSYSEPNTDCHKSDSVRYIMLK